jgi:hypothetical protein
MSGPMSIYLVVAFVVHCGCKDLEALVGSQEDTPAELLYSASSHKNSA